MDERHEIRWGGFAGLAYAVTALLGYFIVGNPPRVDDSAAVVAGHFADNQNQVLAQTLLTAIAAVCLVAFASALAQALRDRMPGSDVPWLVVTGAVLVSALMFVGANVTAALSFVPAQEATTMTLFTVTSILFTTVGIAAALPLTAAAVGIVATGLLPRWAGWFAALAALVGVVLMQRSEGGGLGIGGEPLHNWVFQPDDVDTDVLREAMEMSGAVVMGRRLFDIVDGPGGWNDDMGYGAGHAATPAKAAKQIVKGVERGTYWVYTSQDIRLMFWLQRFFEPGYRLLMRVMNDGFVRAMKKTEASELDSGSLR